MRKGFRTLGIVMKWYSTLHDSSIQNEVISPKREWGLHADQGSHGQVGVV